MPKRKVFGKNKDSMFVTSPVFQEFIEPYSAVAATGSAKHSTTASRIVVSSKAG
jgi:hypothetical protein